MAQDKMPPKPSDGRPQPEKGANKDPKTWKVVPMRDDPSKFKVVDSNDVNVADLFDSESTAKQYVTHYVWLIEHPCPEGQIRDASGRCVEAKDIITAFPTDPAAIGFNEDIAEYQDKGERQEVDIKAGAPHEEGVYVIYVKHNDRIGKDQYSLKLGMGGGGGEYEHTNQLGGVDHRAGWRWEAEHLQYTPSDVKATKVNPQMEERTERGLTTGFASKEQGFLLVKMRSPNNNATIYDVYVDDRDGRGWKWAYSNLFKDKNGGDHGCCDQTGRGYNDDDMRLEVRFQDQDRRLKFTAANYKPGRPNGYTSPSGL
jgi:hypothetical protein